MADSVSPAPKRSYSKRRGCFTMVLVTLLVLVIGGVGLIWYINRFIDDAPRELPSVAADPVVAKDVRARWDQFDAELKSDQPASPFSVTLDEVNTLIQTDPEFETARGKVFFRAEDDHIVAELSLPLEELGAGAKGYFNGSIVFDAEVGADGRLEVQPIAIRAPDGASVPEVLLRSIDPQELADRFAESPEVIEHLKKIGSITIEDGKVVITPRASE